MKKLLKLSITLLVVMLAVLTLVSCNPNNQQTEQSAKVEFNEEVLTNYSQCKIVDKEVIAYDENGDRINYNKEFIEYNTDVYYVVNNFVVTGLYLVDEKVYYFNDNGVYQDFAVNEIFFNFNGDVYYVINNTIVYNQMIIDGNVYNFGPDGKMVTGQKDGYYYDQNGHMIADNEFITINNSVYYLINNTVVCNKLIKADGREYNLDENGKLVSDGILVTINNNVYCVVNNVIVYNEIVLVEGSFYCFDENGKMVTGEKDGKTYGEDGKLVANEIFITINNNVYYIINNVIVYNQIIIDGAVYDFGDDGKMVTGEKDGKTYGEDGKLVADEIFITINNNVYYIINNVIVYNQIIIDGAVYDFGDDGKMVTGEKDGKTYGEDGRLIADKVLITINNTVYCIVNNVIVYNEIVLVGDSFYCFDEEGKMVTGEKDGNVYGEDGRLVADKVFVTINNNVYYIINNVIVYNQIFIDGAVYDFGDDGKMVTGEKDGNVYGEDGRLIADKVFITVNNNVYYIINNIIVYNTYIIHDGKVYYMTETGERFENGEHDGYEFSSEGHIVADDVKITIDGVTHHIVNNEISAKVNVTGTVYESDNDFTLENNDKLAGVLVTLKVGDDVKTATTDSNGCFEFSDVDSMETVTLTATLDGYIAVEATLSDLSEEVVVVMDREVSNNLAGTVYIADTDSTITNNSPLAGALVTLTRTSSTNTLYYETTTDANGYYSFTGLTAGVYTLTISKEGYISITQTVQVRYNETTINNVAIEAIPSVSDEGGYASGYVTEALRGTGVEGLTVYIYEGINTTFGEYLERLTTDSNGCYATGELAPGNYTAYVVDERELDDEAYRYSSAVIAIKVLSGQTSDNQNTTVSNSVGLDIDGMRIILTWGSSPSDLDSHLIYGGYHIFYNNKVESNANLDLDDTSAYGPETVTITEMGSYRYTYYIYNFSKYGTMYASQACVKVYFGNSSEPAYTFYPPQGSGYYWNVFSYDAVTGEFIINNTVGSSVPTN